MEQELASCFESFTEIRRLSLFHEHRASLSIEKDGGRKMAVEKAREGNKKAGVGGRGPVVTSHSVISLWVTGKKRGGRGGEQFLVEFGERSRA